MKITIIFNCCFISLIFIYFLFWLIHGMIISDINGAILIIYATAYLYGGILVLSQGIFFGVYYIFKRVPIFFFSFLTFVITGIFLTINNILSDKILTP